MKHLKSVDHCWVRFPSDSIMLIFFEKFKSLARNLEAVLLIESEYFYFLGLECSWFVVFGDASLRSRVCQKQSLQIHECDITENTVILEVCVFCSRNE